ncbi:alpha/beta hydrolase [Mycobacterium sp.]|uniref:alpha/beta fold hydrolase n=1 Tax=Mycobacterium sp. TaxID=1785 RepID=UPI002CAA258B|nr:alpha/beta hydrolase [Mycobacterium sp.]HME50079.1 alpha/beta hydrolase [Mycobacterium sp.]
MLTSTERSVETNGVELRVIEAGERGAPVVILAHGFPELAYSWRHQIPALAEAGYHVLAPDQRGYGGSSKPAAIEDYDIAALTGDLTGLLDNAGAERAVFVGHDWGANVVWAEPLLHPDRVAGVVGVSVPPIPRPRVPPTHAFKRIFGDNFFYIPYFQEPGVADADLGRDPATTMRRLFTEPGTVLFTDPGTVLSGPASEAAAKPLPGWISQQEVDHYIAEFTRTGFTGPLNWYRNMDRNWELTATTPADTITAPSLFIGGSDDPVLLFSRRDRASEVVSGPYREVIIDGAGHWVQQERPEEVNAELLDFLSGLELR